MTREEAISIMKVIVHMLEEKYDTDRVEEAVDMAIEALQQKPICPSAGIDCEKLPAYEKKPNINEVLDKIRAEMDGLLNDEDSNMYAQGVMNCLEIVDKFIAEGSDKE